jgi:hypothetical protein
MGVGQCRNALMSSTETAASDEPSLHVSERAEDSDGSLCDECVPASSIV